MENTKQMGQVINLHERIKEIYEECGLCGHLTDVKKETPISERRGYVVGFGQTCPELCSEYNESILSYQFEREAV